MQRIIWLRKITPDSLSQVGKKAFELSNLYIKNFPVSPGFIVTVDAYIEFYKSVEQKIMEMLEKAENEQKIAEAASQVQRLILGSPLSSKFEDELREAYDSMDIPITIGKKTDAHFILNTTQKAKVKVRSSPTASTPEAAAGDFPTYLNVEGIEQLKRAVKACWAAVFTSAAIKYRTENNFSHSDVYNPVIVQKMVQSEKSGIVLTSNPENRNEMPISALRGYSIGLNEFRPSKYIIDKKSNKVIRKDEVEQIYGYFGAAKGRSVKKELPFSVISEPVLSDLEIIRLSNIANEIESEFRRDFIIEFAIEDERTFITDLKEIKEVQMKFKAKDEEIDEESEDIEDSKGKEIEEDIDEDIEEDTEEETKEHAEEETEEDIEETEEDTEETEKKTEDEYESDEDLMDDDRSKDLSDEEDDSELEDDKSGELEADEEEADKEESDSDFDEEAEKEEADDGQSEDSNDDDEKEEKLNELFEEYSEKINQLLGELKEESLRILRE